MLFGLGVTSPNDDDNEINRRITILEDQFNLVMIMEYFEESLILLKDLLCWTFEDITYFELNGRKDNSVHNMSESLRNTIMEWNKGDVALYQHFNRTFWGKVRDFGEERMRTEVEILRRRNQEFKARCLQNENDIESDGETALNMYQPQGIKMNQMQIRLEAVNDTDCLRRIYPQRVYTPILREALLNKKKIDKA
uniref:Galactosylceramide sulfotransferase-like n=1 Tax=Saccoglossus kowalevskii TaxID=10224 RepID=A0ABM0GUK3_SACKO|nr:PREDICTED: galactosylceramide sulfotransferase-like [Saccoglossus kowalevskii]